MARKIVAVYGKKFSGKSTFSRRCRDEYNFHALSHADPIRELVAQFIQDFGYSWHEAWGFLTEPEKKEIEIPGIGKSGRYLMQTIGSEWGRRLVGEDVWIRILNQRLEHDYTMADVIVDDLRFHNEYKNLVGLGATLVRLDRPGVERGDSHESEAGLDSCNFDYSILNDGSLEDYLRAVDFVMKKVRDA